MRTLDRHVRHALSSDRSAAFIYDLATAMPPMALSTVKAASDMFDRGAIEPARKSFGLAGGFRSAAACL